MHQIEDTLAKLTERTSLMTLRELAALLNVKENTIYDWYQEGMDDPLPRVVLSPRCIRFSPQAVAEWLRRRVTTSTAQTIKRSTRMDRRAAKLAAANT